MKFVQTAKILVIGGLAAGAIVGAVPSCAPRPPYRPPAPPPPRSTTSKPPPASAPAQETARKPIPEEAKIKEQDVRSKTPPPQITSKELPNEAPASPEVLPPPLPDDSSLLAKITPGVSPQRAASLRMTEEGRKLLDAGDASRAMTRLEKTIVIDSTNPYGYFYLAKAQYALHQYKESLNFLDVAESRLNGEPFWLAEVYALRGENYRALGMLPKAEASYAEALRLNSGNRTASQALSRLQGESQAPVAQH